ncbi:MAG: haloacid dehalogenase-like hydrolase [Bacteroidetes bacterium]|jgi:phosphoserine phosphatase|nr:haloacid dehalogenase-like hydrolase [Bacteroidota bacterium]
MSNSIVSRPLVDLRVIPSELHDAVMRVEAGIPRGQVRRAVFDLDQTLLRGDIGEAVHARLLIDREPVRLSWDQYRAMVAKDPPAAYLAAADALRGLPIEVVVQATVKLVTTSTRELLLERSLIPVPRPHPVMRALIALLHNLGFAVHVITASHQLPARIVCLEYFGIPEERVHGVRSAIDGDRLSDRLLAPHPIGAGKCDVYRTFVGTDAPFVAGGDSALDLPMLDLVSDEGLIVWVGEDRVRFEMMKGRLGGRRTFAFVHRTATGSRSRAQAVA